MSHGFAETCLGLPFRRLSFPFERDNLVGLVLFCVFVFPMYLLYAVGQNIYAEFRFSHSSRVVGVQKYIRSAQ